MKLLIDMNLSPEWVEVLHRRGIPSVHWSTVGDPRAADAVIMEWARDQNYIVFTQDLDFGALLAATHARGPSVVQVRTQDVTPKNLERLLLASLEAHAEALVDGGLLTIDEAKSRIRLLPFGDRSKAGSSR